MYSFCAVVKKSSPVLGGVLGVLGLVGSAFVFSLVEPLRSLVMLLGETLLILRMFGVL